MNIKLLKYDYSRKFKYFHFHLHNKYFDIRNKYIKKLNNFLLNKELNKDVLDVFWTSYMRSIYVLCPGGNLMGKYMIMVHNKNTTILHKISWD